MADAPLTVSERFRVFKRAVIGPTNELIYRLFKPAKRRKRDRQWAERVADVLASPDNNAIPRHPDAGKVIGNTQVMHNGLLVAKGCYYGAFGTRMFEQAKGVHEPQEERVFASVLQHIPAGGVMLELGAYWGFYSMWFASQVRSARCILVEPISDNLDFGRANFRLNGLTAEYVQAGISDRPGRVRKVGDVTSVDALVERLGLKHIHVLHSDIQGFEDSMLKGASKALAAGIIDYIFISTHSQALHEGCRATLQSAGFEIIADADMNETYSFDGLLVGKRTGVAGPDRVPISRRSTAATTAAV